MSTTRPLVAFRVDASASIGAGHFARCLTLADALRGRRVHSKFLCRHLPAAFVEMVASRGHDLVRLDSAGRTATEKGRLQHSSWLGVDQQYDAEQLCAALASDDFEWLVVDHYALDVEWEQKVRGIARGLLVIDDLADRQHACEILLDQNYYEDGPARYVGRLRESCHTLLGPKYALLSEEFRRARVGVKSRSGEVRRILLFFGGVDAANVTCAAVTTLVRLNRPDIAVDVIVGSQNPKSEEIAAACEIGGFTLHVQTNRMAELMVAADLAIGTGGAATWERCCVGLPALAISVAQNQHRQVSDAALAGLLYAPSITTVSPETLLPHVRALLENPRLLASISRNAMAAVDGNGTARVMRAMGILNISVRRATTEDSRNLFDWRNHPTIREVSRSTAPLAWSGHESWLRSVLADPARILLIGEMAGRPAGVVRFDIEAESAQVSIYKVPDRPEPGLGRDLLCAAEDWLRQHRTDVRRLIAVVLGDNLRSRKLFERAGYSADTTAYTKELK